VTVVGPELGIADAHATAAFAMSPSAAEWIASLGGYDGMVILETERVVCTRGSGRLPRRLAGRELDGRAPTRLGYELITFNVSGPPP
jgi:hypothetical protein